MKILKFGGSSLGTPDRIRGVRTIIRSNPLPCVVVVSAFEGITDYLIRIAEMAAGGKKEYDEELLKLIGKHREIAASLISDKNDLDKAYKWIENIYVELGEIVRGLFLLRESTKHAIDQILATGERMSSYIISLFLDDSVYIDSRELIKTLGKPGNAIVDFITTNELIRSALGKSEKLTVIPGYIASNSNGQTTTLGRGGSDYTAAIVAAALNAEILEIWKDVDGFMTADPRKVDKAYTIDSLSYFEAMELSHFGAKVIYTPTLRPVFSGKIPVLVKNTFNPEARGTLISDNPTD
ncbi:MAG: aspartate kinase, partial [Bacteroidales bacterium]|nr:aspartate kinase [Bacteroidales bacterium]